MRRVVTGALLAALSAFPPMALPAGPWPAEGSIEAYFTPWDDAEGALLKALRQARRSIRVQAYLITSRNFVRALADARTRGVTVEVLADQEMATRGDNSLVPHLHSEGFDVRLEGRYAAAHNKIVLIDVEEGEPIVVTGSYNYSFAAQARNAENLLVLRGSRAVAGAYLRNWVRHRDEALPYALVVEGGAR